MAKIDVPYLISKPGKGGTTRYFWQPSAKLRAAGWRAERLPDDVGAAIERAKARNVELEVWRQGRGQPATVEAGPMPGTVASLIRLYKASRFFSKLADNTRKDYDRNLRLIENWAGDAPVKSISPKLVQAYYESMFEATPAQANSVIRVLRLLMQHGVRENMITINPAEKPGLVGRPFSGKIWPREAVDLFVKTADAMGRHSIGTAAMINRWLGQRQGDILSMQRSQYRDGVFHITQHKTAARVAVPHSQAVAQRVAEELARQDTRKVTATTIIVSETTGRPYEKYNFAHLFAEIRAEAAKEMPEIADLQFMHLRHTAITELAAAGCEVPEIASISGHTLKTVHDILEHYLVRSSKLAQSAIEKRLRAEQK